MKFENSYFEGEIREGFYVQSLMKKAWAAQLEVLKEIDVICKRHNIKYFAEWGTLLGAIRHKGYIPWDDDLDIAMLRGDFEKFRYYAPKEIPERYSFYDVNTDGFDEQMARVVNADKIYLDKEFLDQFHGCPYPIGVDVFCLDNIPKDKEEEQLILTLLASADILGHQWDSTEITEKEKWENVRQLEELTGVHFDKEKSVKKQLLLLADKISAMYWDDQGSDEVSFLFLMATRPHYRLPLSCFENIIEVPFENTMIPVPEGYEQVLQLRYGQNYMQPIKKWNTHDYPYFRPYIQTLKDYCQNNKMEMPESFDMRDNREEEGIG